MSTLPGWNKRVFGNIHYRKKKKRLKARINGIQRAASYGRNLFLDKLEMELQKDLEEVLEQEEVLWFQKSCASWIRNGDRNTRYYHTKTLSGVGATRSYPFKTRLVIGCLTNLFLKTLL